MNRLKSRLQLNRISLLYLFSSYRFRLIRILKHFLFIHSNKDTRYLKPHSPLEWIIDLVFYLMDLMVIPDIYELFIVWVFWDIRQLNDNEKEIAIKVFDTSIQIDSVRINQNMSTFIQRIAQAFVSYNTVHCRANMHPAILVHELVHIWQYQKYGSMYIYRALKAQFSKEGYDYGGGESLYNAMLKNKRFVEFNFEQQGDIIEDYYRLRYDNNKSSYIFQAAYHHFMLQVRESV